MPHSPRHPTAGHLQPGPTGRPWRKGHSANGKPTEGRPPQQEPGKAWSHGAPEKPATKQRSHRGSLNNYITHKRGQD